MFPARRGMQHAALVKGLHLSPAAGTATLLGAARSERWLEPRRAAAPRDVSNAPKASIEPRARCFRERCRRDRCRDAPRHRTGATEWTDRCLFAKPAARMQCCSSWVVRCFSGHAAALGARFHTRCPVLLSRHQSSADPMRRVCRRARLATSRQPVAFGLEVQQGWSCSRWRVSRRRRRHPGACWRPLILC